MMTSNSFPGCTLILFILYGSSPAANSASPVELSLGGARSAILNAKQNGEELVFSSPNSVDALEAICETNLEGSFDADSASCRTKRSSFHIDKSDGIIRYTAKNTLDEALPVSSDLKHKEFSAILPVTTMRYVGGGVRIDKPLEKKEITYTATPRIGFRAESEAFDSLWSINSKEGRLKRVNAIFSKHWPDHQLTLELGEFFSQSGILAAYGTTRGVRLKKWNLNEKGDLRVQKSAAIRGFITGSAVALYKVNGKVLREIPLNPGFYSLPQDSFEDLPPNGVVEVVDSEGRTVSSSYEVGAGRAGSLLVPSTYEWTLEAGRASEFASRTNAPDENSFSFFGRLGVSESVTGGLGIDHTGRQTTTSLKLATRLPKGLGELGASVSKNSAHDEKSHTRQSPRASLYYEGTNSESSSFGADWQQYHRLASGPTDTLMPIDSLRIRASTKFGSMALTAGIERRHFEGRASESTYTVSSGLPLNRFGSISYGFYYFDGRISRSPWAAYALWQIPLGSGSMSSVSVRHANSKSTIDFGYSLSFSQELDADRSLQLNAGSDGASRVTGEWKSSKAMYSATGSADSKGKITGSAHFKSFVSLHDGEYVISREIPSSPVAISSSSLLDEGSVYIDGDIKPTIKLDSSGSGILPTEFSPLKQHKFQVTPKNTELGIIVDTPMVRGAVNRASGHLLQFNARRALPARVKFELPFKASDAYYSRVRSGFMEWFLESDGTAYFDDLGKDAPSSIVVEWFEGGLRKLCVVEDFGQKLKEKMDLYPSRAPNGEFRQLDINVKCNPL